MIEIDHLNGENLEQVIAKIDDIESSLSGLVILLTRVKSVDFDGDDLCGVGKLIRGQINELDEVKDILECGHIRYEVE